MQCLSINFAGYPLTNSIDIQFMNGTCRNNEKKFTEIDLSLILFAVQKWVSDNKVYYTLIQLTEIYIFARIPPLISFILIGVGAIFSRCINLINNGRILLFFVRIYLQNYFANVCILNYNCYQRNCIFATFLTLQPPGDFASLKGLGGVIIRVFKSIAMNSKFQFQQKY